MLAYNYDSKSYDSTREAAQKAANAMKMDMGLEFNDLFKTYRYFILPKVGNRYGHELRCEVVRSE